MKVAVGCDHGGYGLKQVICQLLGSLGHQVVDHGTNSADSVDYPDYAKSVCADIQEKRCDCGILICGTGIGMSMVANRYADIRAAVCQDSYTAQMSREHNNANVLCLGERVVGPGLAAAIVTTWMATEFAGGRHLRRINMF